MIGGELDTTLVVLKDLANYLWLMSVSGEASKSEFLQKIEEIDDLTESGGQGDVFGLRCAEGNQGLHLGGPEDRTPSVEDNVPGAGVGTKRIV